MCEAAPQLSRGWPVRNRPQGLAPNTPCSCPPAELAQPGAGLMAFLVELETLTALVSIGTLSTFFMLALGVLWRRYHAPEGPVEPTLVAQLLGVTLCGAGMRLTTQDVVPASRRRHQRCGS